MYKTILRTLSALSIVTITASAGFAQSTGDTDCDAPWNQNHEDCTVSTKIWLDGFTPSINDAAATDGDNQFLRFGPNGFKKDDDTLIFSNNPKSSGDPERGKLNLKRANNTIGGVLFYRDINMASSSYRYYAGIKSGTNLGRPLTEGLVEASWSNGSDTWTGGRFKAVGGRDDYNANKKNFELNVTFGGVTDAGKDGSISALVNLQGTEHYRIDGEFDGKGVITGTVVYGLFNASNKFAAPYTNLGRIDGTLSGLIGDQGAVGVFYSKADRNSYGIYGFSGGFVVKSNFDVGEADLFRICVLNPFGNLCRDTKFDSHKIARIEHCITDNNWVSDRNCVGAIGATGKSSCILNPFQTACKDANAGYADQYVVARADRVAFCEQSANSENDACTVITVADVCGVNPFGEVCEGKFDEAANNRLIECQQDGIAADNSRCAQADSIIGICELAPFKDECTWGAFDDERKDLIATCHNGGECADAVLERPNAATWVNSFKTAGNTQGLRDAVADTINRESESPGSQFLKNIKGVLPEEVRTQHSGYIDNVIIGGRLYNNLSGRIFNYTFMNLKTAEFSIDGTATALGGDEEDGVATFFVSSGNNQYAGIYSTTDLGAPLTTPLENEPKTASWVGNFHAGLRSNSGNGTYQRSTEDFVLEVNFDDQSIEAFVSVESYANLVKGKYDDNGVISGSVSRGWGNVTRNKLQNSRSTLYPLTGLIGKEGAVGAFGGVDYGLYGGKFVARPADLVGETGAVDAFLNKTCTADPFHRFCYLSDKREARINLCSTGDYALNASVGGINCVAAAESDPCILHPFNEECKPTAGSHHEIARENRNDFCNDPDSTGDDFDTLCKGAEGAEHAALCSYDPFNRICLKQSDAFCANEPDHLYCGNSIYDNARKAACKAGSSHEDCATTYQPSRNVTTASWLADVYKDEGLFLPTEPDTARLRNQFLQGIEGGLNTGRLTDYRGNAIVPTTLNLNTATFDGLKLGRDVADGVAYFRGYSGRRITRYAGILFGADLGEPLVETPPGGKWYGQFQIWNSFKDFTLNINFTGENADGSIGTAEAFVSNLSNYHHILKGKFDRNGVISGTVVHVIPANYDPSDLTTKPNGIVSRLSGLIGQEGAIGVFDIGGGFAVSSKSPADSFDSNVKFSDWLRSFGDTSPLPTHVPYSGTQQTRFVQGTETGLDNRSSYFRNVLPRSLTFADVGTGGEVADGVAYVSGINSDQNTGHYAGLLSGTNLGAALPTVPAGAGGKAITATWYGKLGLIANQVEIPKRDIKLTVDFTNKEISYSDALNGAHFVNLRANWESDVGYDGVLKGTITYNPGAALNAATNSTGKVTGLIGRDGAVGAFISDEGSATPYAGGFVADPGVNFLDWVDSFGNPTSLPTIVPWIDRQGQQTEFVQGTGTSLNVGNTIGHKLETLKLSDGDLGGQAADGVAYMGKNWKFRENGSEIDVPRHHAGILSGTYLGLPLFTVPAGANGAITAIWDGKLGLIADVDSDIPKRDIGLTVDFTNNKISYSGAVNGAHFVKLNAKWINDDSPVGVLKGTITYNPGAALDNLDADSTRNSAGIVTGLIGQEGAVGAFRSNHVVEPTATHTSFAGGFVAVPVVNFLNWVNSFGNPTSLPIIVPWYADGQQQTQFLQGREADLKPGNINDLVPRSLDFANSGLGGEAADGVAYISGTWEVKKIDHPRHFAGILSGTHLGAPLDASVAATWSGKLGMIVDGNGDIPKRDITLNIDFASKEISHSSAVNGKHFVDLSAKWINDDSAAGVLKGTITYNPGAALNAATNSAGKVTGLIGQQGAVGAFISNHDNPSSKAAYAGGFVARPPSE